jgi:hypothetical protein
MALPVPITINDLTDVLAYSPYINKTPKTIHIGQRKLFLSHLQFLTQTLDNAYDERYVLYSGAAPGYGIFHLSQIFFPNVKFILFDPHFIPIEGVIMSSDMKDFVNKIKKSSNKIFIFREYFTDNIAKMLSNKFDKLLFISDIRIHTGESKYPSDYDVLECTSMQFNWVHILNPAMTSLKFRQPFYNDDSVKIRGNEKNVNFELSKKYGIDFIKNFNNKKFEYFTGIFYLQAWSRHTSSETRLTIDSSDAHATSEIDIKRYEDAMFAYNVNQRTKKQYIQNIKGKDNCGDCAIESSIIIDYHKKYNGHTIKFINNILNKIFKNIH